MHVRKTEKYQGDHFNSDKKQTESNEKKTDQKQTKKQTKIINLQVMKNNDCNQL